jgi:hypothetical protein
MATIIGTGTEAEEPSGRVCVRARVGCSLATSELKSCLERQYNRVNLASLNRLMCWSKCSGVSARTRSSSHPHSWRRLRVLRRLRVCDCGGDDGLHCVHHEAGDAVSAVCAASAPVAGALTHLTRNHRAQSEASGHW